MNNWREIVVSTTATIRDAMLVIDRMGTQFVMVLSEDDKLLGVITDGDIRRGILRNLSLDSQVSEIVNRTPRVLSATTNISDSHIFLKRHHITHAPLVDLDQKVKGVASIDDPHKTLTRNNTAVLMVGGLGSRLGELTKNCPKPMLKVGEKPVLEMIIDNLREHGFEDIIFCVNYKAEMIKAYFGNGSKFNVNIRYVEEKKRLGTAGALSLLPEGVNGPLLIMNGDIVTRVNFTRILDFHFENNASATMAVRNYEMQVPFGVIRTSEHRISSIDEKPLQTFMVNAGIYILEKKFLSRVKPGRFYDMPQLFEDIMEEQELAQAFPIHEYWIDIGNESDLLRASLEVNQWKKS